MNILVLYTKYARTDRQTFTDSLQCFKRYSPKDSFTYLNVVTGEEIRGFMKYIEYDAVIMHYTFLAKRQNRPPWPNFYKTVLPKIQSLSGVKVMIPQDEYYFTQSLRDMIRDFAVDLVFTNADEKNLALLYPRDEVGDRVEFVRVLTGYIDEKTLPRLTKLQKGILERDIGLGYRGMKLPYYFGSHGQLKYEAAARFEEFLKEYPMVHADLGMTGVRDQTVLYGDDWLRFLLRSRCTLACLGGSSLLVLDSLQQKVADYIEEHPKATYEETEAAVFPGEDGKINMQLLSPKMFEAAMAKSCLVMVEGDYWGVFKPGVHFIEVKKDYSNIGSVVDDIQNHALCRKISLQCYHDIIEPKGLDNPFTYTSYVHTVLSHIGEKRALLPASLRADTRFASRFFWASDKAFRTLKEAAISTLSFMKTVCATISNTLAWPFRKIADIFKKNIYYPILCPLYCNIVYPLGRKIWVLIRYQSVYCVRWVLNLPYVFFDTHPKVRNFVKKILMVDKWKRQEPLTLTESEITEKDPMAP